MKYDIYISKIMPFVNYLGYDVLNPKQVINQMEVDDSDGIDVICISENNEEVIYVSIQVNTPTKDNIKLASLNSFFESKVTFLLVTDGEDAFIYSQMIRGIYKELPDPLVRFKINQSLDQSIYEIISNSNLLLASERHFLITKYAYIDELTKRLKSEFESPSEDFLDLIFKGIFDSKRVYSSKSRLLTEALNELAVDFLNKNTNSKQLKNMKI